MAAPENDVPLLRPRDLFERPGPIPEMRLRGLTGDEHPSIVKRHVSKSLSGRSATSTSCGPNDTSGPCQRSTGAGNNTVPIVIGVVIPVMIAAIILFVLHRRHRMIQRKEDAEDKYKSLDFGVDEKQLPVPKKSMRGRKASKKAPPVTARDVRSALRKDKGLSMDLDMSNPYMLPPELHSSRESLHSLSRSLTTRDDKYRATDFIPDDGSIRSPSVRGLRDDSSSYAGSIRRQFDAPSRTGTHNSRTASPAPPAPPAKAMLAPPSLPQMDRNSTVSTASSNGNVAAFRASNNYLGAFISGGAQKEEEKKKQDAPKDLPAVPQSTVSDLGSFSPGNGPTSPPEIYELPDQNSSVYAAPPQIPEIHIPMASEREPRLPHMSVTPDPAPAPAPAPPVQDSLHHNSQPASNTHSSLYPEQPRSMNRVSYQEDDQGFNYHQGDQYGYQDQYHQTDQYGYDNQHQHGSYQGQHNHDSYQANAYNQPTLPNIQVQHHEDDDAASDYYDEEEGFDEFASYMGYAYRGSMMGMRPLPPDDPSENPEQRANRIRSFYKEYFDDSMDPAKRQSYFHDDGAFDEVYGYYEQSHPYYRPSYARSDRGRAYSNGSFMPGPRAYSSMSGRPGGPRMRPKKKKLPPPKPLQMLPTPHKLKDDDFIPNAIDYAPPQMFKNQRSGTPDSLRGGLRPYSPSVRPHIPLNSSFDDLAVIPSPHQLRRSGLFTGLDFAPPRRFKEPGESMSETGSIRSNRSGISAMATHNIRAGAYRLSRIPKNVAGTKDDMMQALRPQWDIGRA